MAGISVAFVLSARHSPEESAAWKWLVDSGIDARLLTPAQVPDGLSEHGLLWWHAAAPSPPRLRPAAALGLRQWLERGGRLLLSLHAAALLAELGLEDRPPDELGPSLWRHSDTELEALEGERRGAIGFGPHPVFDGLQRGAFLLAPREGALYPRAVYTGATRGRVVAAEWQYLALDASRRIVLEHELGAGRVLTVGAHLLFAQPADPYRLFLERFASNCLEYLAADHVANPGCFWPAVELVEPHSGLGGDIRRPASSAERSRARVEQAAGAERSLSSDHPGDAQFDLAGRRVIVLGRYRTGVTEVWSLPVRLAQDVVAHFDDVPESSALKSVRIFPAAIERVMETARARLVQTVATNADEATIRYEVLAGHVDVAQIAFEVDLRYFWPYPEGALGQPRLHSGEGETLIFDGQGMPHGAFRFEPPIDLQDVQISNGSLRVTARFEQPRSFGVSFRATHNVSTGHAEPLLEVETPDAAFDEELFWAMNGLRSFDVESAVGRGLVAGFAETGSGWWSGRLGYAWYFGRDAIWSSFACLAIGLRQVVAESLRLFASFQQLDGKIVHELTPAGVAHFTAADSTPLFLVGLERYLRWTGDLEFVREVWPKARLALAFCFSTDTDGDGLIENTGVGHGWSEGGRIYGAHATFYLNACWAAALEAMVRLAEVMGDPPLAAHCSAAAGRVGRQLNGRLYRAGEGWFAYGIAHDGSTMTAKTIEPAVAAMFGLLEPRLTEHFFGELASDRYTAPWGVRYIARDDPAYHPRGYHHGSVWPLFTGWAAAAEYAYGRPRAAYQHVRSSLALIRQRSLGAIDEVLDGDDGSSAGVCPHQLWSHAMTVTPVIEGLLGIRPDGAKRRLVLRPQLPPYWDRVRVRGLRIGGETLSFTYERHSLTIDERSSDELAIDFQPCR